MFELGADGAANEEVVLHLLFGGHDTDALRSMLVCKCLFLGRFRERIRAGRGHLSASHSDIYICVGAASRVYPRPPPACCLREVVGGEKARLFMMEWWIED